MMTVKVGKTRRALVDDDDYASVAPHRWNYRRHQNSNRETAWAMIDGKFWAMHRYLMQPTAEQYVDHINHDGLDNRRSVNLRVCSPQQSTFNRRCGTNSSGFKGVYPTNEASTWSARIGLNGGVRCLGSFRDKEDAARAYDKACIELHGEFAVTNASLGLLR